ncbi:TetR/AcrR family transcriptional regulator [Actinomadura flavalba]|uniref:TetR/AcrR family transcriptional regulator n=1 Tax=Actinomadura flavalba TaxID=1120938 RepID=UPI0003A0A0E8|nr:TetR family transcriptional regulator [Actinomadura flavalba]
MTVKKLGRPSLARQRRDEILLAMATVVARDGLPATTLAAVAEAAGLRRTLVLHYFRSRDELVAAFVEEVVSAYGREMIWGDPCLPAADRLDALFAPGAYADEADLRVWTELVTLASRDTAVRDRLRHLWADHWLPEAERQLAAEYPSAPSEDIAATAYTLACLVEAHWTFHLQGIAEPRRHHLHATATALLTRLSPPANHPDPAAP